MHSYLRNSNLVVALPHLLVLAGFLRCLVHSFFLGCPWRAYLRLEAVISLQFAGIVGLFAGVLGGIFFANQGFSLGKSKGTKPIFWLNRSNLCRDFACLCLNPI